MYSSPFAASTNWINLSCRSSQETSLFTTHELNPIDSIISPHELIDIALVHPLGYHRKPVLFQIHAEQREDVRVPEVPPRDSFSTEFLQTPRSIGAPGACGGERPAHAEALSKITSQVDTHNLYSDCTTIVFSPGYDRVTPIILLDQLPVQTFGHMHRLGNHPLATTHLA